jgi:N utilization substance protein B
VSSRHRARRLALQGLCCLDAQGAKASELVREFIDDSTEDGQTIQAAHDLARDAFADWPACDQFLVRHARHWDLGRLAMVDRNILRLAAHELLSARAPQKVVITEAIRLAREFSSAESPRFINGILDAVAKEITRDAKAGRDARPGRDAGAGRDAGDAGDRDSDKKAEERTEEAE